MEKDTIEIPFGAKDSELKGWEYTIPEGMEAEIKDGKIILKEKENEDEKIMKEIIDWMKGGDTYKWQDNKERWIAYLERQKDLDKMIVVSPEVWDKAINDAYENGKKDNEKQKEQIPYIDFVIRPHKGDDTNPYDMPVSEAQEYAIKRGFGIPFNDDEVYVDERHITQTIGNILRWADEHPKEQKPLTTDETELNSVAFLEQMGYTCIPPGKEQKPAEWSEEDEYCRNQLIVFCENCMQQDSAAIRCANWLKSLPERFNLHPKVEWNEEDEEMIARICANLEYLTKEAGCDSEFKEKLEERIKWMQRLKSLRPQPKEQYVEKYPEDKSFEDEWKDYYNNSLVSRLPKNKRQVAEHFYWFSKKNAWKPSEEQMKALKDVVETYRIRHNASVGGLKPFMLIESLYEQLKKL